MNTRSMDVLLPGEMCVTLSQVVEAQKEAEANIIRHREKTNATRSLLRLKELETLEAIAHKIDRINVSKGTKGPLDGLVQLSDINNTKGHLGVRVKL